MEYAFLTVLLSVILPVVVGLLLLVIAARLVTRTVLDEIRKDRAKRGPLV
ncbi:MAG TPA: hypothetical protein VFM06_10035 [Candidatus Limnocylindria bacterium]|nr:hypothetical protein [Candidatus Limnocylindria bacterium]